MRVQGASGLEHETPRAYDLAGLEKATNRSLDLHEFRQRFGRYDVGAWFLIDDANVGWQGKRRPFVLNAPFSGGPTARVFARSSSRKSKLPHRPHPKRHSAGCQINRSGWIVPMRLTLRAEDLNGTFMCDEPDESVVTELRRRGR